jgi:hypothetical protein
LKYENEVLPIAAEAKELSTNKVAPFIQNESNGILGAGLTAAGKRNTDFVRQITAYKDSLESLRNASINKQPKAKLLLLQDQINRTHKTLNTTFNAELQRYMPKAGKKGTVWSSATRGAGLARGARTDAPINLTNTQEVAKLKNLGRGITVAGNGLLILDAGFRVNKVLAEKEKGADWQRKMVKETAGFGLGGAAGIAIGELAVTTASMFLASTPVGWIVIIGVGLTAGYLASKAGDAGGQFLAEFAYDTSSNTRWFN